MLLRPVVRDYLLPFIQIFLGRKQRTSKSLPEHYGAGEFVVLNAEIILIEFHI